jgi:hypothetical protein
MALRKSDVVIVRVKPISGIFRQLLFPGDPWVEITILNLFWGKDIDKLFQCPKCTFVHKTLGVYICTHVLTAGVMIKL